MQNQMLIELILMNCDECGSNEQVYDEVMGERICKECGLVLVTEIFEQTTNVFDTNDELIHSAELNQLGSLIKGNGSYKYNRYGKANVLPKKILDGIYHCNMVLSNVAPQMSLKDRVEELYIQFMNKGLFGKTTYEARATAVVYYALLENGTQHTIKEVSVEFPESLKSARKLIRKIKQTVGVKNLPYNPNFRLVKTVQLITDDLVFLAEAEAALVFFENAILNSDYTKSPAYYAAICWIAAKRMVHPTILKKTVAEKTQTNVKTIYLETKKLITLIGFDNIKQIKGKQIW